MTNWNNYFFKLCLAVASNSKCRSRQIGVIIVRNNAIVSTGYNGPPRGMKHCGTLNKTCPRTQMLDYQSGRFLEKCPAGHAESNAIAQAAMNGTALYGTSLYINTCLPCKDCMGKIINAGIKEVHCSEIGHYDELSLKMVEQCDIKVFQHGVEVKSCQTIKN